MIIHQAEYEEENPQNFIEGVGWVQARSVPLQSRFFKGEYIREKFKACWLILNGKADAFVFATEKEVHSERER